MAPRSAPCPRRRHRRRRPPERHARRRPPARHVGRSPRLGLAREFGFFLWTFWILGDRRAGWRSFVPGAVVGALGLEVLKLVGTVLVPRMVASSSSLYGPIGVVFAIIAWLTIFSRLIVYSSALNAVRYEEDHGFTTLEIRAPLFEGEVPVDGRSRRRGGRHRARRGPQLTAMRDGRTVGEVVGASLARVTSALPGGGEERPGQVAMAHAVLRAIIDGRHVVVQAGTGTGKSLAYLVPAAMSGKPVVIATATKALQDQLVGKDLPFVAEHLDESLTFAVLKGRSNYVCRQRLGEIDASAQQLALDGLVERAPEEELRDIKTWAGTTAHRRPGRAGLRAVARGVGGGERGLPGVPGRLALPAGWVVLRRGGPQPRQRRRRGGGQPPPLRPPPRERRRRPARARRRHHRRGPPARGRDLVDVRRRPHRRRASPPWPGWPAPCWRTR